jgi:hypothetical protein
VKEAQARSETKGIKLAPGRMMRDIEMDNSYDCPCEIMDTVEGKMR